MDGFAVRSTDIGEALTELRIEGRVLAGDLSEATVSEGCAVGVMTGAVVPNGADAVQPVEQTELTSDGRVRLLTRPEKGQHIMRAGEEVERGTVVLQPGEVLSNPRIAVLATFGYSSVEVCRSPIVRIVTTGDELVNPDRVPEFGQIRNSNSAMLAAQTASLGVLRSSTQHVRDCREALREELQREDGSEVLLFSGGVSMGERDLVHKVVAESGFEIVFHKAAVKPGKPILFATRGGQVLFGLPGNPVSSFVSFELFVRPAIRQMVGFRNPNLPHGRCVLSGEVRQKPGRLFFMPGRASFSGSELRASILPTKGSADICSFASANCLVVMPGDRSRLEKDEETDILLLESFFTEGDRHEAVTFR
jgi:molybdopterin molybdotransferase